VPVPTTIRRGEHEGRPCLPVPVAELDLDDEGCLVQYVTRHRRPGIAFIELVGDVPWGAQPLDRALLMLAADARSADMVEVWQCRRVSEQRWAASPLWWVHDASELFAHARSISSVIESISLLPFVPPPAELVVVNPHPTQISAALLDEVSTRLDPGVSWLYVEHGSKEAIVAEREVAKANTPWGVRYSGTT
jgi:hypothetical protein